MKLLPQEVEVWYIIPAIRAGMVKILLDRKLKQNEIAKILGLTEAAVSQYKKHKRANKKFEINEEDTKEIEASVEAILQKKSCAIKEIQRIVDFLKSKGSLCDVHKKYNEVCAQCKQSI